MVLPAIISTLRPHLEIVMRVIAASYVLLSYFLLTNNSTAAYPGSELAICVIACKAGDGSYDFALESSDSLQGFSGYNFLIPAAAWFNESLDDLGMSFLTIKSSAEFDDAIQAYWAGFLELYISRNMTYSHLENTFGGALLVSMVL